MSYTDEFVDENHEDIEVRGAASTGFRSTSGGGALDTVPTVAALAPVQRGSALVRPAATVEEITKAFQDYQRLSDQLLEESDYQKIGDRLFRKKSAWRKLGTMYGASYAMPSRPLYERDADGRIIRAEFVVRAIAPNGRYADGWGACDRYERCCLPNCRKRHKHCSSDCPGWVHFSHAEHDIPATAETRAKNRACADLFGLGEVSAEEIVGEDDASREQRLRDEQARERGWTDFDEEHRWHDELRNAIRTANAEWNRQVAEDPAVGQPDAIRALMIEWQEEHRVERWPMDRETYAEALAYLRALLSDDEPAEAPTSPAEPSEAVGAGTGADDAPKGSQAP